MTSEKPDWNQHHLRKYDFPLGDIPRLNCMDPQVDELIRQKVSVVVNLYFLHVAKCLGPTVRKK